MKADLSFTVVEWSCARKNFNSQIEQVRIVVEQQKPDIIVITNIPRHHAKKLGQSEWSKDYFVSKEVRNVTETSRLETIKVVPDKNRIGEIPTPISVLFSKFPTSSEEWFSLENDIGFAHVVQICMPLNSWIPDRCPLSMLQEYQLTYDEVSTIAFVVTTEMTTELQATFNPTTVKNSVVFISPKGCDPQLRLWKVNGTVGDAPIITRKLMSCIGEADADE